jgi:phospholipid/cholesterol/gamma-HCH transport system substrate-binding protein
MMRRALALGVASLLVMSGCALHPNDNTLPGQTAVGSDGFTVTATFDTIENLVPNSTVQRDDVVIGTVTRIKVADWKAIVTMRLKKSERIPANATFTIGQKTLLGAQFVDIVDPPSPRGVLADGAKVRQDKTAGYPETEQILSAVSLLLNNGGLSQVSTITGELNKTLDHRVPDARQLIRQLNELLGTLDRRKTDILRTLDSLNSLTKRIADERKTVTRAIDTIGPGLESLNAERTQLVDAVSSLGQFSTAANRLVNTSQQALLSNLGALRPILADIDRAGDDLPKSLDFLISLPFPVLSTDEAVKGDFANLFATLDVSVPSLTTAFLGQAAGESPSIQATDPVAGPVGSDANLLADLAGKVGEDSSAGASAAPAPKPTPSGSTGCGLLEKLLGGCS